VSFSTMLNIYLCTLLSYYSFFMMWQVTGWGTRNKVEVSLKKQATVEQANP
ncbi:hypothetical protein I6N95_26600, partial [Vagococcus sp. BWB3-3]|nr:hypothetical protein [Vagococcus allomyrinae]